jgi:hypothetical protein
VAASYSSRAKANNYAFSASSGSPSAFRKFSCICFNRSGPPGGWLDFG